MLIGGMAGYFGGAVDAVLMRFVEVLMTIPSIYLLVGGGALAGGTYRRGLSSAQRFMLIVLNYFLNRLVWSGAGH